MFDFKMLSLMFLGEKVDSVTVGTQECLQNTW